ncbi:GTPase [Gimesia aquarii]|uniref:tRNA modification GTPase MnmE n=1 Tax=Gimesia aquarii TaxID=2527964 RepID=A0A517W3G5_9PLAN|nr:GTPase [Gimesia aquarii]QDT99796.1 tRNA modification GTPase MnmE [Gimesia aquarii]
MSDRSETNSHSACSAALLTPRGRGAVATIRVHGEPHRLTDMINAYFQAANQKSFDQHPLNRIVYGLWGQSNNEDLVICRLDPETVDIHCHGGLAAIERILNNLESQSCEIQTWQELMKKSQPALNVELQETLIAATTFRTAEILLRQSQGLLSAAFKALLPDSKTAFDSDQLQSQIRGLLRWKNLGLHLSTPWRVVLAGRPNVGKSSLINALLGYDRSIVFDEAGTTRDVLTATTAIEGWPFQFSDTAGIREQAAPLEAAGIQRAEQILAEADCQVILLDTSQPAHADDHRLLSQWPDSIVVAHKADLPQQWDAALPKQAIAVSSKTNSGLDTLMKQLVKRLIPEIPDENTAIPVTVRQTRLLEEASLALEDSEHQMCCKLIQQLISVD